jgi:hypothetical protein
VADDSRAWTVKDAPQVLRMQLLKLRVQQLQVLWRRGCTDEVIE